MEDGRLGHRYVFVSCSVVEQISFAAFQHALDENNIGHLADSLPLLCRLEEGPLASPKEFARIVAVRECGPPAADPPFVRAVINQNDPRRRDDRPVSPILPPPGGINTARAQ